MTFYNRQSEPEILLALIETVGESKSQNVALVSLRREGKTQILFELKRLLGKDVVSIYA